MIGHLAIQAEPAKPPVSKIEVDLFTQAALRADPRAIAHDQHAEQEFRVDRGSSGGAVEGSEVLPHTTEVNEPIDGSEKMAGRHVPVQTEPEKERLLLDRLPAHHDRVLRRPTELNLTAVTISTPPFSTQSVSSGPKNFHSAFYLAQI